MNRSLELGRQIKAARKKKRLSQEALAFAVGVTRAAVSNWETSKDSPRLGSLRRVAEALEIPLSRLWSEEDNIPVNGDPTLLTIVTEKEEADSVGAGKRSQREEMSGNGVVEIANVAIPKPGSWLRDLPVYGGAECGTGEGWFELHGDDVVDRLPRPPILNGVVGVYAVYAVGDSMEPLYENGDPIYVHPGRRPEVGREVLVQFHSANGDVVKAVVKRLVKQTPTKLIVEQFNPAKRIEYDLDTVKCVHRVLRTKELLGS